MSTNKRIMNQIVKNLNETTKTYDKLAKKIIKFNKEYFLTNNPDIPVFLFWSFVVENFLVYPRGKGPGAVLPSSAHCSRCGKYFGDYFNKTKVASHFDAKHEEVIAAYLIST